MKNILKNLNEFNFEQCKTYEPIRKKTMKERESKRKKITKRINIQK